MQMNILKMDILSTATGNANGQTLERGAVHNFYMEELSLLKEEQ